MNAQRRRRRVQAFAALTLVASALAACDSDDVCRVELDAIAQYLDEPAHRACQSDQDCAVVNTGCHTFPRGFCGQATVNTQAAQAQEWTELEGALRDCQSGDDCTLCAGQLVVTCASGLCGRR